jgi:hypothetical protein
MDVANWPFDNESPGPPLFRKSIRHNGQFANEPPTNQLLTGYKSVLSQSSTEGAMCNKSLCLNLIGPNWDEVRDRALWLFNFSSARALKCQVKD